MVRNYKPVRGKKSRRRVNMVDVKKALESVKQGMSVNTAAKNTIYLDGRLL